MKKNRSKSIATEVLGDSILRVAISKIPVIGDFLVEVFQFQSNVKQKRLMDFVETFYEYAKQNRIELKIEAPQEIIGDLTESVFRKVSSTNSKEKLKYFQTILIKGITDIDFPFDQSESFLQLILELNEVEILILNSHQALNLESTNNELEIQPIRERLNQLRAQEFSEKQTNLKGFANNLTKVQTQIRKAEKDLSEREIYAEKVHKYREGSFYNISEEEFLFHKQKLFSKGLMLDAGSGRSDFTQFSLMCITQFGISFLKYITETH